MEHLLKELFSQLSSGKITKKRLQAFLQDHHGSSNDAGKYPVFVDYNRSMMRMVIDGRYDHECHDLLVRRRTGIERVSLELIHMNRDVDTEDVRTYLREKGLLPATVEELLAFGVTYPEVQREFRIVAVGHPDSSSNEGLGKVGYLHGNGSRRHVTISDSKHTWEKDCRFLARSPKM